MLAGRSFTGGGIPFLVGSKSKSETEIQPRTMSATEAFDNMCAAFSSSIELSERESEVFRLAMQGKNLSVIASELFIANSTVKTHLRNIYRKAGVSNRQELIEAFQTFERIEERQSSR